MFMSHPSLFSVCMHVCVCEHARAQAWISSTVSSRFNVDVMINLYSDGCQEVHHQCESTNKPPNLCLTSIQIRVSRQAPKASVQIWESQQAPIASVQIWQPTSPLGWCQNLSQSTSPRASVQIRVSQLAPRSSVQIWVSQQTPRSSVQIWVSQQQAPGSSVQIWVSQQQAPRSSVQIWYPTSPPGWCPNLSQSTSPQESVNKPTELTSKISVSWQALSASILI